MSQPILEVTVSWGPTILEVRHLSIGEHFNLGEDSALGGTEGFIAAGETLTLARVEPTGPRILLPPGVPALYQVGDDITPLPTEQSRSLVLGREGRLRAEVGALTLFFQRVEPAAHPGRGSLRGLFGDVRWVGGAAVMHAVFLLLAWVLPPDGQSLTFDALDTEDRFVNVAFAPTESREKDLFKQLTAQEKTEPGDGADVPGPTTPDAPSGSMPEPVVQGKPRGDTPTLTRADRIKRAVTAAGELTTALDRTGGDLFAGVSPLSGSATAAVDGLNGGDGGRQLALAGGSWGGTGVTAGGPDGPGGPGGPASVGPAGYTTRTGRPGPRTGFPEERGPGEPRVKVVPQKPEVEDGLTRDEIQRVVRLKQDEYRFCYEKQLQQRHDLEGKITLKFVVGPDGRVLKTEVLESTVADPEVGACIANKARRWQFPTPRGGGVVAVRYPFLFRRS